MIFSNHGPVSAWRYAGRGPSGLDEDSVLAIIQKWSERGRKVWTPSRILGRMGFTHDRAESRPLLLRTQRLMKRLEDKGRIGAAPGNRSSRVRSAA